MRTGDAGSIIGVHLLMAQVRSRAATLLLAQTVLSLLFLPGCKSDDSHQNSNSDPTADSPSQAALPSNSDSSLPPVTSPVTSATKPIFVEWRPDEVGMDDWLQIRSLVPQSRSGWATGRVDTIENRVEIQTEGVQRIELDLTRMDLNWNRRVWIRIDDQAAELARGASDIKELELSDAGRWIPARGSEPSPAPK